jgi:3-oxoacyl-[acyl-carrier protein] reductase
MTETKVSDHHSDRDRSRGEERRVALVTGASGTIGAAIAKTLASVGFRVAVHYRQGKESADAVVASIVAAGG